MKKFVVIIILVFLFSCLIDLPDRNEVQCSGVTVTGERCTRMTTSSNGYCWEHQDQAKEDMEIDSTSIKNKIHTLQM
ncbi:MAG: hypothetical protein JXR48_03305 [Candidatus Delongbacteria bacterium]|nr:hypothetical protein [Candidatus Delongbacteria bacterium]MBN2833975.1 hypothetical protein [Candidatus Delongbacteria bacterium]